MKHLTDNEIQSYLQSGRSDKLAHIKEHLRNCPDCQKQLLLYKKLGDMVISTSLNPIPEGFERAVVGRLRSMQRQRRITDVIVTAVAFVGFAIVGAIVLLTPQLRHILTECLMDAWQYGSELTTAAEGSSDAVAILAFGVVMLVFFGVVDRLTAAKLGSATGLRGHPERD
jgi:predicted anti-sigma-YlaC factor YlaD